jgi:hypothetical protein
MHLLKALHQFSLKQIHPVHQQHPTALDAVCKTYPDKPTSDNGNEERITSLVQTIRRGEIYKLHYRDIRRFMSAAGTIPLIDDAVIRASLQEIDQRHDSRLVSAAFKALLASYRDEQIRTRLRRFCGPHLGMLSSNLRDFAERSGILIADGNVGTLAERLVQYKDIPRFSVEHGIGSTILMSNYGLELKLAAIRHAVSLEDVAAIQLILDWSFAGEYGTPLGDFYEAMLQRFESQFPLPTVQKALLSRALQHYGDPRINEWPGLIGPDSYSRRERCISTIKRWLSIEYLDLFIKIIEKTSVDRQFAPRKAFWLKYFEADKIGDITLVLAADADKVARKAQQQLHSAEYMQWSTLHGALPNQSVLLMRMDDLIIAEWSHSGAIRFWDVDTPASPKFHMKSYYGHTLSVRLKTCGVIGIICVSKEVV